MPNVISEVENILQTLQDTGYYTEEVQQNGDGTGIFNISRDGDYMVTMTLTRTPGYDESPEATLAGQPETAAQIDRFLDDPSTGVALERPRHAA
jgi:hypothetical protein